jgi:hypothetical protein
MMPSRNPTSAATGRVKRGSIPSPWAVRRPGVHADHQKFAVGEIDDIHHTENDGQPQGHQGQDHADEQTGKE